MCEQLEGAGILKLGSNCEAKVGTNRVTASGTITETLNSTYRPLIGINISQIIPDLALHHVGILSDHQEKELPGVLQDILTRHPSSNKLMTEYITYGLPGLGGLVHHPHRLDRSAAQKAMLHQQSQKTFDSGDEI